MKSKNNRKDTKDATLKNASKSASMKNVTVLLTSAGVATAGNVISALRNQNYYNIKIVATDMDEFAFGLYLADKKYLSPAITDKKYFDRILEICKKESVEIILPLLSKENLIFSKNINKFTKLGIKLAVCAPEVVELFEDKMKSIEFFEKNYIPCPKLFDSKEAYKTKFPLFVKPLHGSSSKNTFKVENAKDLDYVLSKVSNPVIQEFLEGEEYTTDVLADSNSDLVVAIPRIRLNVKDGKCMKGKTVKNDEIIKYVKDIVKKGKIIGPANIQCIMVNKIPKFIEVNTRFSAGGLPLVVHAGANTPLLLVKMLLDDKIYPEETQWKSGSYMVRYLTELFPEK